MTRVGQPTLQVLHLETETRDQIVNRRLASPPPPPEGDDVRATQSLERLGRGHGGTASAGVGDLDDLFEDSWGESDDEIESSGNTSAETADEEITPQRLIKSLEKVKERIESASLPEEVKNSFLRRVQDLTGSIRGASSEELEELADRIDTLKTEFQESQGRVRSLQSLLNKIENSGETTEATRSEYREKAEELQRKFLSGEVEDIESELSTLQSEFESAVEENPTLTGKLLNFLRQDQVTTNRAAIESALKDSGLTEASLQNISLPPDKEISVKLIEFFKKVDSKFASYWNAEPNNPYRDQVRQRLKSLLQTLNPSLEGSLTDRNLDAFIDRSTPVTWPGDKIGENIGGSWGRSETESLLCEMNNAVQSGNWGQVSLIINGRDPAGRGAHMINDRCRRIASAIYLAAHSDIHLFKRYMQMIPDNIRHDMANTLLEDQGELHEIQAGDQWDSQTTADWIRWTLGERDNPPSGSSPSPSTGDS